ncbi:hypothetical protein BGZ65_000593 [Modicella reniformis]|uniref:Uncharacterized protein n=1 Tax=Modicella reniformis TaxID=1440133 RepID=A0A9P6MC10_9FUNG|nr:hypothetical protein BGZ65_000593 [Modicella reniformis]
MGWLLRTGNSWIEVDGISRSAQSFKKLYNNVEDIALRLRGVPDSCLRADLRECVQFSPGVLEDKIALIAVLGALVAYLSAPAIVTLLGFEAAVIVAGTPAAAIMASYGGAATSGSLCVILQSIGAWRASSSLHASLEAG